MVPGRERDPRFTVSIRWMATSPAQRGSWCSGLVRFLRGIGPRIISSDRDRMKVKERPRTGRGAILGFKLKPLSLGHALLLDRFGLLSAVAGPGPGTSSAQLALMIWICARPWGDSIASIVGIPARLRRAWVAGRISPRLAEARLDAAAFMREQLAGRNRLAIAEAETSMTPEETDAFLVDLVTHGSILGHAGLRLPLQIVVDRLADLSEAGVLPVVLRKSAAGTAPSIPDALTEDSGGERAENRNALEILRSIARACAGGNPSAVPMEVPHG